MAELNEQQFTEAYDKYADAIFRHCYYRVFDREIAKDFMQEAFCKTWKYLSDGHHIDNLRAFLYRTANNLIIDASRKKKHMSLDGLMEKGFVPHSDPRQTANDHATAKEVMAVIDSLDEKYRQVMILKYVDDLSPKEISEVVGEKENNVYIRLHRGLAKVKEIIAKQENQKK